MAKPPDLDIPTYDADRFGPWKDGKGSAFASDFGALRDPPPHKQVWSDACDVGFWVQGKHWRKLFTLAGEERHNGEFAGWRYTSPRGRFTIVLFNT